MLRQKDVICVASVGNEGPDMSRSPGNYRDVISVGAIDARDKVAHFSSSQRFNVKSESAFSVPSVVAPGVSIVFSGRKVGLVGNDRDLIGFGTCCGSRCATTRRLHREPAR